MKLSFLNGLILPLVTALIVYIFSIHSDFIRLKAQVGANENILVSMEKKIDHIDQKVDDIRSYLVDKGR